MIEIGDRVVTKETRNLFHAAKAYHMIIAAAIDVEHSLGEEQVELLKRLIWDSYLDSTSCEILEELIDHWHQLGVDG